MASQQPQTGTVGPDTLITVKVLLGDTNRRFKLALRDLGAHVLPQKLRLLLAIPSNTDILLERYSDSAGRYILLDSTIPAVYKQLYRAAKAKLKLRLRATIKDPQNVADGCNSNENKAVTLVEHDNVTKEAPRQNSYLETVLSQLPPLGEPTPSIKSADPVPCAYVMPGAYSVYPRANLSHPTLPNLSDFSHGAFSIDCNYCGKTVPNEHYHCSICEKGDFDLCQACVDRGMNCPGEGHWLIKRTIKNGRVFPSVTEKLRPKSNNVKESQTTKTVTASSSIQEEEERTCNSCISQLPASSFVTCKDCPDFDLCYHCFGQSEHGHHPAHVFQPVSKGSAMMTSSIQNMLDAGRGFKHDAFCDGCDKHVVGVRHKCLSCPDFDFCSMCLKYASDTHPGHRFAPIYEQLKGVSNLLTQELHRGIYCDGNLCSGLAHKAWISGDRYKCTVCDDFDLCANCEADPVSYHNKTHPLIKIKTPIRFVTIATINEDEATKTSTKLGDKPTAKNASTETTRSTSTNAATQVQTVAEVKPVETTKIAENGTKGAASTELQAWFESDSTPDGTSVEPDHYISQSWTLHNPGPQPWPAGCAVHYIGGDDMRNLDMRHPSSVSRMAAATQSNVLPETLEPGKTAVFTVLLKSPMRTGRAISYWRLKTPDGHPFGHKLWVDINVAVAQKSIQTPEVEAVPVPEPFKVNVEDAAQEKSTMIFPKLEKESPESSILEISKASSTVAETDTLVDDDLVEDLESLDLAEEDDTEDGFLTDEEYDILDADDEEFLEEAQRVVAGQK